MSKKKFSYIVITCLMLITFIAPLAHSVQSDDKKYQFENNIFRLVHKEAMWNFISDRYEWEKNKEYYMAAYIRQIMSMDHVIYFVEKYWVPPEVITKTGMPKESQIIARCIKESKIPEYSTYNWTKCEQCIEGGLN